MSVKSGLNVGVIKLLVDDNAIYTVDPNKRISVEGFNCQATASATVTFYSSPDDTSASGEEIATETFAEGEDLDINAIVNQGYSAGTRIIAVPDVTGVNASFTYTQYDGDSV